MADGTLRGNRLGGSSSREQDRGHGYAPRRLVTFTCPAEHTTRVPFADEAELPQRWECGTCGAGAERDGQRAGDRPEPRSTVKTHLEQLMSRRSPAELQRLLDEALSQLQARRSA